MKLSKVGRKGTDYLKIRKSKAKETYFNTNDIDYEIDGNYIYIQDTTLALDLLDLELNPVTQTNISDSFNEISNLLYSKVLKSNISFETSKDIAKDIKDILKQYYSNDKLKSLITESKRSSQKVAGYRASLTRKLKKIEKKGTTFKKIDTLAIAVTQELIRRSDLDVKFSDYVSENFPSLLKE